MRFACVLCEKYRAEGPREEVCSQANGFSQLVSPNFWAEDSGMRQSLSQILFPTFTATDQSDRSKEERRSEPSENKQSKFYSVWHSAKLSRQQCNILQEAG